MVFDDEFNGDSLNTDKWTAYQDCWGGGNAERQCYTAMPQNVSVNNGALQLTARLQTAKGPALPADMRKPGEDVPMKAQPFTSGKISTKGHFDFTYGRIEVRAKLPGGQGVWPAIWALPDKFNYGPWPGSGEIDVMEAVNLGAKCFKCYGGIESRVYGTIHYGSVMRKKSQQGKYALGKKNIDDWHVYRVDWSPDDITWYVDGKKYYHVNLHDWRETLGNKGDIAPSIHNAPFDRPFYLILNLAVGGQWPEGTDEGGVYLKGFPKTMSVDWVRVYQCEKGNTACND